VRLLLALAALIGPAGPAIAATQADASVPAPPLWQGIWSGTFGDEAVRVCLAGRGGYRFGAYYRMRTLRAVHLEPPGESENIWIEQDNRDPNRPRLTLDPAQSATLTGRWAQGGTTRPVRLTRLAGPAMGEETCGSLTFNQPRFTPVRIVSRRARLEGVNYTRLAAEVGPAFEVTVASFALDGATTGVRRVNQALRRVLPGEPAASEWFDCVRGNLNAHGSDGGYERTLEPTMISARWLAVRDHSDTYCGGNHPNVENRSRTFDLASGREINLHDWLTPAAVIRTRYPGSEEVYIQLTERFRRWVVGRPRRGDSDAADCRISILATECWDIRLTRTGLVFTPDLAHVAQACGEEFTIPFARLAPFLNTRGRLGVASLRPVARSGRR